MSSKPRFSIITEAARKKLWPKNTVGLGLYLALVSLVTVEVQDPGNSDKKIGVVLGGHQLTISELAERVGCDPAKLRYEKDVLLREDLLIQHRHSYGFQLAIRECDKWSKKKLALIDPKYKWVVQPQCGAKRRPAKPRQYNLDTVQNSGARQSDIAAPRSDVVAPQSDVVIPQSENTEVVVKSGEDHGFLAGKAEIKEKNIERDESLGESQSQKPLSLSSVTSNGNGQPKFSEFETLLGSLYEIGGETFDGKHRNALHALAERFTTRELIGAYREHVASMDDFQKKNAPKKFCEGGCVSVLMAQAQRMVDRHTQEHLKRRLIEVEQAKARAEADERRAAEEAEAALAGEGLFGTENG
jgi:hypothetical protein